MSSFKFTCKEHFLNLGLCSGVKREICRDCMNNFMPLKERILQYLIKNIKSVSAYGILVSYSVSAYERFIIDLAARGIL